MYYLIYLGDNMENGTTIHISKNLRDELLIRGKKGDTYEDIIWTMVIELRKKKK